ncbi:MAG: glycine cleavage T C-terminal barrel domain-containing protein [Acidimicrobiales bacterium]
MKLVPSPRLRTTPFHDAVVAAGVTDASVYNKMLLPLSFGDPDAEYRRLTEAVSIWDVSVERQVEVRGPDADACVQYLTARDLSNMKHGQGKYVAVCDHEGRILNDPVLLKLSDRYWFSLADSELLLWVRAVAYERGFDVTICEPDVSPLAVQGPKAEALIVDLFGPHITSLKYFWFIETELQRSDHRTELDGIPLVLCRSGWSKQGGFELFLQDSSRGLELWDRVMDAGQKYGIGPGGPNNAERIESGLLSWGGDTTPDSNPFEAGMARYVDVDTPVDYIGKDALKRVAAIGPARLFTGLTIEGGPGLPTAWPLAERSPVWIGDDQVGTVSSVAFSPRLQTTIAVAQIERTVVEGGEAVEISSPTGRRRATITPLPFI